MRGFRFLFLAIAVTIAAVGAGMLVPAFSVSAQIAPSIAVSPEKFELVLSRGEERRVDLRVANQGADSLPVHLSVVRFEAKDEVGGINYTASPEDPTIDIIQWMTLEKNDFILEAGESEKVAVTIRVPKDAEPGGKYGAVFIAPTLPEFYFAEDSTRVLPQIGVFFLITIPLVGFEETLAPSLAVEEFSAVGASPVFSGIASRVASLFRAPFSAFAAEPSVSVSVLTRSASLLTLRIRNNGITHVRPFGKVVIHNLVGREVARTDVSPTTILPGKVRRFPVQFSAKERPLLPAVVERQLALGRYRATVVLEGVGEEPFVASLAYWVFPWQSLLVAFLVFGPLGILVFRFRSRFLAAFRILFRKPAV